MEFRILEPLEVWDGSRHVSLTGPKQRANSQARRRHHGGPRPSAVWALSTKARQVGYRWLGSLASAAECFDAASAIDVTAG